MSPPVQPVFSDGKLPASAEIVIIGAGIAGTAAAYWLAKKAGAANSIATCASCRWR